MRPDFDPRESYLIAYFRDSAQSSSRGAWIFDVAPIVIGGGMFLIGGLWGEDPTWSIIGFGIVAYRLIQHAILTCKYDGAFARIVSKYEASLDAAEAELAGRSAPAVAPPEAVQSAPSEP
ncbi:hypothetical protein [Luteolibacter marinus]|uniref:hypothetical protein n=1 Tax=Luteolibacter marinus TaxID=2776705 RepID=UPI001868E11C|nr:hypothetical protein [Luteolibacter marinus]